MNFLTIERIVDFNRSISEYYKLEHRVINWDLLDSIVVLPERSFYEVEMFPTIYDKAAGILEAIIRFHPFYDGNKRTSLLTSFEFLLANDYIFFIPIWAPRFLVGVAKYQKQGMKDNQRLLKDISSWLEKYSAKSSDAQKIRKIMSRYSRALRILKTLAKVPLIKYVVGIVMVSLLQLKIYSDVDKEEKGMRDFLEGTYKKISSYIKETGSQENGDQGSR